ncbi:MAG TPA: response regulator, partial [Gemmatimonadales bacterium]|nr:response regulator [Gemmatimonadales bacterium]
DDSEVNRDLLARRLERLGYRVVPAENGARALAILGESDIDLVLLDILMPEMDGYAVLERRRSDPKLRDIPFIVISALDELDSVVRCVEMGAEDYLTKPFDPVLLRARIEACLEKKRLRDQEKEHLATIQAQSAELAELNRTLEARVGQQVDDIVRLRRLQRFLSPQIAEAIISSGGEQALEAHRREITVASCDLRGFTAFSETAEPEDVMAVLREYHAAMGELIFHFDGTLEHFAGDGMMIFFNDPVPSPDPAGQAVRMALAMRDRAAELATAWRKRGHQLAFGMGIAMGYATLGRIGFEGRFDYGAIGSVTNLASRLCGEAAAGQILVSERICGCVEDVAVTESMGNLELRGFSRPVPAFNVVDLR